MPFADLLQVVRQLLAVAGTEVDVLDNGGCTPLHWAAAAGSTPVVKCLIQAAANVNATASDGSTPLHQAATAGHLAVAEALLGAGAVAGVKASNGNSPLHCAAQVQLCNKLNKLRSLVFTSHRLP